MGSFEQVEGVCGPGAGGRYGEAAVAGCGDGVSHAGCGGAGGCEDEQAGGVVAVGEVAQGTFGEVVGFTASGDAGEKLGCHGFSLSGGRRLYLGSLSTSTTEKRPQSSLRLKVLNIMLSSPTSQISKLVGEPQT